jgi:peptide/nickel transport system ATP-binding protein
MTNFVATDASAILDTQNVTLEFPVSASASQVLGRRKYVHAVNKVSLSLKRGSATALVGESGSGKSTLARLLAGLYVPTSGEILLEGAAVRTKSLKRFRAYSKNVQLILQDPYASLNPHRTIGYHVTRPLKIHGFVSANTPRSEVVEEGCRLLEQVGLTPGINFYNCYPHQLSGGQRQRASIARALAARPKVLIADEPVSMLDVSLRRGILELLKGLQRNGLTIFYITHDLPSAAYFSEDIAVMYAGEIVEQGPARRVVQHPVHPYTQLLLSATPDAFRTKKPRAVEAQGEAPSLIDLPTGCPFHPRCPHAMDRCTVDKPELIHDSGSQWASCWLIDPAGGSKVSIRNGKQGVAG